MSFLLYLTIFQYEIYGLECGAGSELSIKELEYQHENLETTVRFIDHGRREGIWDKVHNIWKVLLGRDLRRGIEMFERRGQSGVFENSGNIGNIGERGREVLGPVGGTLRLELPPVENTAWEQKRAPPPVAGPSASQLKENIRRADTMGMPLPTITMPENLLSVPQASKAAGELR